MPQVSNFIIKESPTQVLPSKLCQIFKRIFLTEHLRATASTNTYYFQLTPHLQNNSIQRHPSIIVLINRRSENMEQIHRRAPLSNCDFNKAVLNICWNHTSAWVSSWVFAAYFQITFSYEHLWRAVSVGLIDSNTFTQDIIVTDIS